MNRFFSVSGARSVLFLLAFLLTFGSQAGAENPADKTLSLNADADSIYLAPEIASAFEEGAALVRVGCWEYYPNAPFLSRFDGVGDDCQDDGYPQDRPLYSPQNVDFFIERPEKTPEGYKIPRYTDDGRDKVYDRFYVTSGRSESVGGNPDANKLEPYGKILAGPSFVTELPSLCDGPREEPGSIKGLEAVDLDDAKELGVAHAAMTLDLCWILQTENVDTLDFNCNGKTWRFNRKAVEYYDAWTKKATDYGMQVTFVLVFWGQRIKLAPEGTIFPDYERWTDMAYTLSIAAPNTATREGCERLMALYEFLGSRYTAPDKAHGRAANFVIGNELNSGFIWNNMGKLPLDETVRQYGRQLRIAYTALRKYWSGARVLASFDNFWTANSAHDFGFSQYDGKGGFGAREYLLALAAQTRSEGDYPWHVAFHPYGLDLRTPVYWDQFSVESAARNEDARRVTPYNIEILPQFLARDEMKCNGAARDFYFTEQGFASPQDDDYGNYHDELYDPDHLPQVWLDRQSAAYAYAHFKFVAVGAKANIFHRQQDVKSERLNIGLWARPADKETGKGARKPIWDLFRQIDKPGAEELTLKYLPILRFYPDEKPAETWDELIPNFNVVRNALNRQ